MGFPGGVLVRKDEQTGNQSYTLIGSLKGCDPYGRDKSTDASEVGAFYNMLLTLEEYVQQQAFENSVKWFGKKRSLEAVRDSFKKIISVSSDKIDGEYVPNGKYPPSFRVKVPVYDGSVKTDIIDKMGNPIYSTPDSLVSIFPKGITANLIMSGSIYVIAGGGFGVTWRLQTAQVFARARVTAADIFSAEEDESPELPPPTQDQSLDDVQHPSTPVDQGYFASLQTPWNLDPLVDQRAGGSIAWAMGEIPILLALVATFIQWMRDDKRETKRIDRNEARLAAMGEPDELAQYNAYLTSLAAKDTERNK
jgi:hypothetical protein